MAPLPHSGDGATQGGMATRGVVTPAAAERITAVDHWLAHRIQQRIEAARVRFLLWDGWTPYAGPSPPLGDVLVCDRGTLLSLIANDQLYFGEAYMTGRLEVRGALREIVEALCVLSWPVPTWRTRLAAALTPPNTLRVSRHNVHHHYDLGNDFFSLWLDREMVYTCAYFPERGTSLEAAQREKLDLVCRKVRLTSNDTVVEAGCGWGALALHMAREYGARVKAFNVSPEQLTFARDRAAREGLASRVEFIDDDYRNVSGRFDVFVSVGMLEHVGLHQLGSVAHVLGRVVKRNGGRGLLHFIGRDMPYPLNAWIRRRIFPGAYTPTIDQVATRVLAPAGMSILDVENLRLHYAQTLAHWSDRFAAAADQIRARYGEEFRRAWELYLAGSQAAFATGWMQLFQVLFAPHESTPTALTRAEW